MNCPDCNAPVRPGAKFCTSCGRRLSLPEENPARQASDNNSTAGLAEPKAAARPEDFSTVKGRIYWNIPQGQVARVIDEAEFDSYGNVRGVIVQEGTTAYIRANGKIIAGISGGTYDFTEGPGSSLGRSFRSGWNFLLRLTGKTRGKNEAASGDEAIRKQQEAILENAKNGSAFSVIILLNKAFPLLVGARPSDPDDYKDIEPMTVRSAHLDLKVGLNAYFKISDHEKFIIHYLTGKKRLNTTHILDEISDTVRIILEDVLKDVDPDSSGRLSKELVGRVKDGLNSAAARFFNGLSVVRIVEIAVSGEELERFRALSRELYLSEEELDYLNRTNDFKNRLASVLGNQEVAEVQTELDIRRKLDEVNKDGLLHETELESFVHFLANEQAVRLAQNDNERDAALAELEKTGLIRADEIEEIRHRTATGTWQRNFALSMMQLKDGIEFERVRMEGEADKAVTIVRKELEAEALKSDYQDTRFYKDLDKEKAAAQAGLDLEKARRDMDYDDTKRRHDLKMEEDDAQFRQFLDMQRMAEESRANERRHEADMEKERNRSAEELERMKWEGAKDLSDEKVWALQGGDAAVAYAQSKYNAEAERLAAGRLEAQRREMDSRLDAERASRDAEHRQVQDRMFDMMNNMMNMAAGMQSRSSSENDRRMQEKLEEKDRQLKERDERILRQEERMDSAYDRALDYSTRNNVGSRRVHCPECGAELASNEKFCPECGFKFEQA